MEHILRDDYIELSALLKLVGPFGSGGQVKLIITDELVSVDGKIETRRKCKLRAGQRVVCQEFGLDIVIVAPR
jgi:ribosome-associated protein